MTDPKRVPSTRSTLNRRKFLAAAGAGVAGSSLLTMLDARQAPAQIKGTTLRILQWSHFIPAYDAWCAELDASPVPDSLQHDDLHSANVCWPSHCSAIWYSSSVTWI